MPSRQCGHKTEIQELADIIISLSSPLRTAAGLDRVGGGSCGNPYKEKQPKNEWQSLQIIKHGGCKHLVIKVTKTYRMGTKAGDKKERTRRGVNSTALAAVASSFSPTKRV